MIAFLQRRCAAVRHVVLENPLFRLQLKRLNIYTWFNLIALFTLLLIAWCSVAHLAYLLAAWRKARFSSEALQQQVDFWTVASKGEGIYVPFFSSFTELGYFCGHLVGLGLLLLLLLAAVYKNFLFVDKQRWDHPSSPHIRLLPVSESQVQFALIDLRFFVVSMFTALALLTLLLSPYAYEHYRFFLLGLDVWIALFVLLRFRQLQAPFGQKIWKNPLLPSWLVASVLPIAIPLSFTNVASRLLEMKFFPVLNFLIYGSIQLSLAILLISCWLLKPRLLRQLRIQRP